MYDEVLYFMRLLGRGRQDSAVNVCTLHYTQSVVFHFPFRNAIASHS